MYCTAHSKRTGEPCRAHAVKGKTKCRMHGGTNPGRPLKHGRYSKAPKTLAAKFANHRAMLAGGSLRDTFFNCLREHLPILDKAVENESFPGPEYHMTKAVIDLSADLARAVRKWALDNPADAGYWLNCMGFLEKPRSIQNSNAPGQAAMSSFDKFHGGFPLF